MTESSRPVSLQPRWFIRLFWVAQRAIYSVTRGRLGLRKATDTQLGHDVPADGRAPHR